MNALIYGSIFRHKGVLAQYYTRRESTDYENLAKDIGIDILAKQDFSVTIKRKEFIGKTVLYTARRINGEGMAFIVVAENKAIQRGEEALAEIIAQCDRDMEGGQAPKNLSAHWSKTIRDKIGNRVKDVELGRLVQLETEVDNMAGDAKRNLGRQ